MTDNIPIVTGSAGLTGRQQIARPVDLDEPEGYDENGAPVWASPRAVGKAIPASCRRELSLPPGRSHGCTGCAGVQRNGGCLLDVIRAAEEHGADWVFEVDPRDGFWDYAGPAFPGYEMFKIVEEVGIWEGRWAAGSEPAPRHVIEAQVPPSFVCPFCDTLVEQSLLNFHFWCPSCGCNAKAWEENDG